MTDIREYFDDTIKIYKSSIMDLSGEDLQIMAGAIKYVSEDRVYCTDDKVYLVAWGMTPDVCLAQGCWLRDSRL